MRRVRDDDDSGPKFVCRRYPPRMDGQYPPIDKPGKTWCGEFKEKAP